MKLEKILKIMISIILFSIIIFIWIPNEVNAEASTDSVTGVTTFGIGDMTGSTTGTEEISTVGNKIVQIISTIGSILSVIVIIVLGIKYMMGSVEEKATYKRTLLPFLIGAAFIFAASTIASIVYNVAINL